MSNTIEPGYGAAQPPDGGYGSAVPADGVGDYGYGAPLVLEVILDPEGDGVSPGVAFRLATEAIFDVSPLRRPNIEIGEEGGYLLEVVADTAVFEDGVDYVVKFRETGGVAEYPDTQPGAYSAVSGSPYVVRAVRGGRGLRFTSPAMPHGFGADKFYDIVITGGTLGELVLLSAVNVLPRQVSLEVMAAARLPGNVYSPWAGTSGPLTGSNEA